MEAKNNAREMEKARLVSQFYYTLALLQSKAIKYVAYGETVEDKIVRLKDVVMSLEKRVPQSSWKRFPLKIVERVAGTTT